MSKRILRAAGVLPATSLAAALIHLGPGQAHEAHLHFSAGEPGNPNKPARTVTVLMREMQFEPSRGQSRCLLKLVKQAPLVESYAARSFLPRSWLSSSVC